MIYGLRHFRLYNVFVLVLFFVFTFFLTRQVPLVEYSYMMTIALFGIYLFSSSKIIMVLNETNNLIKILLLANIFFLTILLFYSVIIRGNVPIIALRFFLVLLFILIAYFIKLPKTIVKIFLFLYFIQAILIILFGLSLFLFFNEISYLPIRSLFLSNNWGDVFTYNGWFYRIEIRGNYLIPFAYFCTYILKKTFIIRFYRVIFFIAIFFAGNFAFLISLFFFHIVFFLIKTKRNSILYLKLLILMAIFTLIFVPLTSYVKKTLELKKTTSLNTRWEQADLLIKDFTDSPNKVLFGSGLGNSLEVKTLNRDYEGASYYELQSLYFLNQTGICYFLFFILSNVILCIHFFKRNTEFYLLYGCYIIYAVTNPYIFDSNQIAVILILCTFACSKKKGVEYL